ncbi:MAG: PilN domain-containing protein [Minisyncoccales bacterium]
MPQFITKEEPKPTIGLTILLVFSLILLLGAGTGYFILDKLIKDNESVKKSLEVSITQKQTADRIALKEEMLNLKRKIDNFSYLVDQHLNVNQVFEIIEKNIHPQVWFTKFDLEPRLNKVELEGETQDFTTVGQQISLFQKEEKISQVNLKEIFITKEGKIGFKISLSFVPDIFKF